MRKIILMCILFFVGNISAYASDMYIKVTNNTGYDIYSLYVSSVGSSKWGEDVLDADILEDGDTVQVTIYGHSNPKFDVQAEDEQGDTYTIKNINVNKYDLVFTLDHLD